MSELLQTSLICPACGYDLRGIESERCPECGVVVDRTLAAQPVIPWAFREQMGRYRAFWRTVRLVILHPSRVARDAALPVSFADAQRFRWTVVAFASIPLLMWVLAGQIIYRNEMPGFPSWYPQLMSGQAPPEVELQVIYYAGITIWPVPWIAVLLFIVALTGISSYFFHPRSISVIRQDRAVTLSYYTCAPLSLIGVPAVLLAIMIIDGWHPPAILIDWMLATGIAGSACAIVLVWLNSTLRILSRTTFCSASRLLVAAISMPLAAIVLALLFFALFPMLCGLIRLMIYSYLS